MIAVSVIRRRRLGVALVLGYLAFVALYLGSAGVHLRSPVLLQPTDLDALIPFLESSIWVYVSQFVLLPLSLYVARDDADRSHAFYSMLFATAIAACVFLIWPTQIDRPSIAMNGITGMLWRMLYVTDTPGNCFPSLHVALAAISGVALWRRGWRSLSLAWPLLIAASTLTTRQHVMVDVAGGAVLAALAWHLTPRVLTYESVTDAANIVRA
jgi:membrane-associated phospholipid phosphatase